MDTIYLKKNLRNSFNAIRVTGKPKIFCIGLNKTGTTSLQTEMKNQGFIVGDQREGEWLFDFWVNRDFKPIIRYCRSAQFFQDAPFSYPYTFIAVDQAFRGSKFILTVRESAEQWYESLIRFHGKLWGNGNVPPSAEDLKKADYIYKGFPYHARMHVNNVSEDDPYNKDVLIDYYNTHIKNVKDYFRHRPEDLLVINLQDEDAYERFCRFLDLKQLQNGFPWENKT